MKCDCCGRKAKYSYLNNKTMWIIWCDREACWERVRKSLDRKIEEIEKEIKKQTQYIHELNNLMKGHKWLREKQNRSKPKLE